MVLNPPSSNAIRISFSLFHPETTYLLPDSFKILEKAPVKSVKPSFQTIEIRNVTRKDVVEESLPREKALVNTKNKEKGFFKGPRVV